MNLVYVVKRFPKYSETFVLREIQELERQGERVTVCSLTRPHPGEPRHEGADELAARTLYVPHGPGRVVRLATATIRALVTAPRRAWPALAWCLRWSLHERTPAQLRRFAEACYLQPRLPAEADHIHAHFAHGAASVALVLSRLTGRPFSFTGHAKDIFQIVPPRLLAAKAAEARFVAAVSDYTAEHVRRALAPADQAKVVVVRNGVDAARFDPRPREPDGVPVLLAVSRLVKKKGLDTLIAACALLRARGLDLRCELIGEGPLRPRLERRLSELGLDGSIRLHGSLADGAVRAAYGRAALFVLPCRRTSKGDQDGLPVSIVEAMRVGVPVITTPTSGIPEVVRDGQSGLLVPPDDPPALAAAIERALRDPALRRRLAAGGRAATAEYELDASVARLRRLFRAGPDVD